MQLSQPGGDVNSAGQCFNLINKEPACEQMVGKWKLRRSESLNFFFSILAVMCSRGTAISLVQVAYTKCSYEKKKSQDRLNYKCK